jgi:hypothetical protein
LAYLRLTPEDYRAITRCCRGLDLHERAFRGFRHLLVALLRDDRPELTDRLARLPRHVLRLLFEHLRDRKSGSQRRLADAEEVRPDGLTFEEFRAVARATQRLLLAGGRPSGFRAFLAHHFADQPELARKLAQLTDRQLEELYARLKRPRRWRA